MNILNKNLQNKNTKNNWNNNSYILKYPYNINNI